LPLIEPVIQPRLSQVKGCGNNAGLKPLWILYALRLRW